MALNIDAIQQDPEFQEYQRSDPEGANALLQQYKAENAGTLPRASTAPTPATGLPVVPEATATPVTEGRPRLAWGEQPLTPTQETAAQVIQGVAHPSTWVNPVVATGIPGTGLLKPFTSQQPVTPPGPRARNIASYTPGTPEEYAVDTAVALASMGQLEDIPALSRLAKLAGFEPEIGGAEKVGFAGLRRVALPTLAGGITGAYEHPENRWGGFESGSELGAVTGLGGEAVGGIWGAAGRYHGEEKAFGRYVATSGQNLKDVLEAPISDVPGTAIDIGNMADQRDWLDQFRGVDPKALQSARNAMNNYTSYVDKQISGADIPVVLEDGQPPEMKSFREWNEEITRQDKIGRRLKTGEPVAGPAGDEARDTANRIREQVAAYLDKTYPQLQNGQLGSHWLEYRKRFGVIREIKKEITARGMKIFLKPENIQEQLLTTFGQGRLADQMTGMLGPDAYDQFMEGIQSGLRNPKLPVKSEKGRFHMGLGHPRLTLGTTHKPLGIQPWHIYPPRSIAQAIASPMSPLGRLALHYLPIRQSTTPPPPPPASQLDPNL